ncbi:aminotransferase class IV family protein [Nocardia higoensis]|uniref:Aminotransferase class IV family protein n=2 Tax=Nocardia higoensis TaxID=228599 RepID=A0ABS0DIJ8_9NOCA|nr:aminotransferase class IV family protein [Nocardia higoensis]
MELNGLPVTVDQLKALALVNYGHFTSIRVEGHAGARGLSLHLDRLTRDCREVFGVELDPDRVRSLIRHALNGTDKAVVLRITVYDPALELGRPAAAADPHILVTFREAGTVPLGPLALQSAVYSRDLARVKHIGLFGALHQRRAAQLNGFDDVVFTTPEGAISEIATSNIGFIDEEGRLIWPRADVLPGTTMRLISQALDEDVNTSPITLSQLGDFAAVVATNAAVGVRAVHRIDDARWPVDHQVIDHIRKEYEAIPPERI